MTIGNDLASLRNILIFYENTHCYLEAISFTYISITNSYLTGGKERAQKTVELQLWSVLLCLCFKESNIPSTFYLVASLPAISIKDPKVL